MKIEIRLSPEEIKELVQAHVLKTMDFVTSKSIRVVAGTYASSDWEVIISEAQQINPDAE